ncbi:MAG: hypothetical protein JWM73_2116 [Solirubrobacterales bacterium]|nr:hypothetical protein [Solirubrobacterales bacterium]
MGRLRWRLAGALQWPLFAVLTVVDAVLLRVQPISGTGTPLVDGLLLAMFFNLVAVAGLGRLVGWGLRRRDPSVPRIVAEDRAGVALLCAVTIALVAGGIAHSPGADRQQRAVRAQQAAARAYVLAHGGPVHRARLGSMDTEQHAEDFFRTCVPGDPARHVPALCLLIDTSRDPPKVVVDSDRSPNRHL